MLVLHKGHFYDLGSQAAGLGTEVLFKASGGGGQRGKSPGLPRTLESSGLGSTTSLPGGQLTPQGPTSPVLELRPQAQAVLLILLVAPALTPNPPANAVGRNSKIYPELTPGAHLHCHHLPLPL